MEQEGNTGDSERGGIVTARGTSDGLVIRLDGRVASGNLKSALKDFMQSRRSFIDGSDVLLEWVGGKPELSLVEDLTHLLEEDFGVKVKDSRARELAKASSAVVTDLFPEGEIDPQISDGFVGPPLGGLDARDARAKQADQRGLFGGVDEMADEPGADISGEALAKSAWDDPDARMIFETLRSGQKIETEHSLVVVGDVNPGAELVAGGDIIVLGVLRGIAHAGAYEENGGGRIIFALNLQPTQLRIGSVISRGMPGNQRGPEVARVEGDIITVESFNAKSSWFARRQKV